MELFFTQLLSKLTFFSTGVGVICLAALAAALFLFWEWRTALVALVVLHTGIAALMVNVQRLPVQWAMVQILVAVLCSVILALSATQVRSPAALHPPGPLLLRAMVLVLLAASWGVFDLQLAIPLVNPPIARFFVWVGLCALTTLALSDDPFFTAVALLLWSAPIQAVVQLLAPGHNLFVLIGVIEIIITLACSYLVLIDLMPVVKPQPAPTDISFPQNLPIPVALPTKERRLLPERATNTTTNPTRTPGAAPDAPVALRGSQ